MEIGKIISGYEQIVQAFPFSSLSSDYRYLHIPEVNLPRQYNKSKTDLLINLRPECDYLAPEAYVDRGLRVNGKKSKHLDERMTEWNLLEKGWVKLCVQTSWDPNFSLIDCVVMFIKYLENLRK